LPIQVGRDVRGFASPVDEDRERPFHSYLNYIEGISVLIADTYGMERLQRHRNLVVATHSLKSVNGIHGKPNARIRDVETCLGRTWRDLRRMERELGEDTHDADSNAWLPVMSYYAVHHALGALKAASGDTPYLKHRASIVGGSVEVTLNRLPYPWNVHVKAR
jgi:hypothetical protein